MPRPCLAAPTEILVILIEFYGRLLLAFSDPVRPACGLHWSSAASPGPAALIGTHGASNLFLGRARARLPAWSLWAARWPNFTATLHCIDISLI